MATLELSSPSFSNGEEIPRKYGYKQDNVSPPLVIKGVSSSAQSLALIMDDPDAKAAVGKLWVHWVIWNIDPAVGQIDEGKTPPGALEGKTDFGEVGYGGPAPPDKMHTYIFKLYALDTKLDLQKGATKEQLEEAMKDHIIEQAELKGTFAP